MRKIETIFDRKKMEKEDANVSGDEDKKREKSFNQQGAIKKLDKKYFRYLQNQDRMV